MIRLRTLSPEDVATNADAFLAIAQDGPGEYWRQEHFLRDLPEKWRLSFAAWDGSQPVGYAIVSRKAPTQIHLHHFTVAAAYRSRGLGSRMMDEMIRRAREVGVDRLTLKVDGPRAEVFYRRHAFREIGRDGNYVVFERALALAIVAIHQPNYLPWLGYFHKIAVADLFVFLDDVQFSKSGYINRVKVMAPGGPKWLTVPVSVHLGDAINAVRPARPGWARAHLDSLHNYYKDAPGFRAVWPRLRGIYAELPASGLAAINKALVEAIAREMKLNCRFVASSTLDAGGGTGDDRLIALMRAVAPDGCYLSGRGGAKYQDPEKFAAAGIGFRYADFSHPVYHQGGADFAPGLSALDAVFQLGWEGAAGLLTAGGQEA